jgi:hypothetical protein
MGDFALMTTFPNKELTGMCSSQAINNLHKPGCMRWLLSRCHIYTIVAVMQFTSFANR